MTDKEMLLIAYGSLKQIEDANSYIVELIEKYLAVEALIEKRELEHLIPEQWEDPVKRKK
jgi:hypothetical protein